MHKNRILLTTSLEETWVFNKPVLFLGEWCRQYDRRHVWETMDAIVAPPYGLDTKQEDHEAVSNLISKLMPWFKNEFNLIHRTSHSLRFWEIVLGPFLHYATQVFWNRYSTIDVALSSGKLSGVTVCMAEEILEAPKQTLNALEMLSNQKCNFLIFSNIIRKHKKSSDINLISRYCDPLAKKTEYCYNSGENWKNIVRRFFRFLSRSFRKSDDAFIISPYLSIKNWVFLELALMQCPIPWSWEVLSIESQSDCNLRNKLKIKFNSKYSSDFDKSLGDFLFDLIPIAFLEGFHELRKKVNNHPLPKTPKFVFTSNSFFLDEQFKYWIAELVERGVPYFVGQHGNHYGTYAYSCIVSEVTTCDRFIAWGGWKGESNEAKVVKGFNLKLPQKKSIKRVKNGMLLIVEPPRDFWYTTWDFNFEMQLELKARTEMFKKINKEIRLLSKVRLYSQSKFLQRDQGYWRKVDHNIVFDDLQHGAYMSFSKSRIVLHGYDSTGILETLNQNIPTIGFWTTGYEHLRESALPYYQMLYNVGILHFEIESASSHINNIWDNVDEWWKSEKVQGARNIFCDRYSRTTTHPVHELKMLLLENAEQVRWERENGASLP